MAKISPNRYAVNRIEESIEDESSSTKRQKIETLNDRLSELPESLILHILHLLDDTKQAVRTSALSKRWRNLWTSIQSFSFEHYDRYPRDTLADFVSFVTKALFIQCMDNVKINSFKIHFNLEKCFETHLACWVSYVLCRNVEELDIDANFASSCCHQFLLPNEIFTNWVFTKLRLGYCVFDPDRHIDWKVLRVLCISDSYLSNDLIGNIMNGSPLLESFELESCYGFDHLDITSASVKKLIFNGYGPDDDDAPDFDDVVDINAPNILSLDIIGTFLLWKVLLLDVSSLVEANLDYIKYGHWDFHATRKETRDEVLKGFIQKLHHVKDLAVGNCCSASVLRLEAKGFSFPSNMKYPDDVTSSWYSSSDSENEDLGDPVNHVPDGEEIDNEPDGDEVEHFHDGHGVDNGNNHDEADH